MKVLITGHCGFIGSRLWTRLQTKGGFEVWGLDNLSRATSTPNLEPKSLVGDVSEINSIEELDQHFDFVFHLAAQVSVVEGERDPSLDFKSNAQGTFEVVRWAKARNAGVIYASTNKVYGELEGVTVPISRHFPLKPQTNYGVSKAAGALYVNDYERGWTFHQSCIYGPTQQGTEDQGWVGWLRRSIHEGRPIVCYGDGSQIRDLLYVEDLIDLYLLVTHGTVPPGDYVVGGGPENAVSFSQALELLGGEISRFDEWRPHDQRYFVSGNTDLLTFGWEPRTGFAEGLSRVAD